MTPPVECGLLAGTYRAELLDRGELGERIVTLDDLPRVTRLWTINSVQEWRDARLEPGARGTAVTEAAQRARAHDMIVRLPQGYDTPVGEGGVRLSGGQRQLVALARAHYGSPCLVVLDEANAHLDGEGEQALCAVVEGLRAEGVTVVLITQRTQVLSVADRIAVLRNGSIERIGVRRDAAEAAAAAAGAAPGVGAGVGVLHQAQ
jgi:ABC-type protease/lipase transport system fused ATPase/permease subunit